ncbi:MAG: formylglycine-generating enzyme family protein [Acidobacteria bacterium]|nr:formylglycine-generating enzyme family protein [Acidobacteriota bacterium]
MRISYEGRTAELVHVAGSDYAEYRGGGFFIGTTPVTQWLWTYVMGSNPSCRQGSNLPVENVSWDEITSPGGFLERLNKIESRDGVYRLPTESEWEYAARGGPHWKDGFRWSGSNNVDAVAWYDRKHGDHTQPVALKAPNQLGIYDMSGNVWEWCQDLRSADGDERALRGGCFHNWAVHCTVSKRYEIGQQYKDGCIGFRLVFG